VAVAKYGAGITIIIVIGIIFLIIIYFCEV